MQRIDSTDNKKIKRLTSLKQKKVRLKENLFLIEGLKSVDEAISDGAAVDMILISDSFEDKNKNYCQKLEETDYPLYITSDYNSDKCSSSKTPQGIIAIINKPEYSLKTILGSGKPIVILDSISDPGNLGTIVRSADAFGFGGVLLLPGCADVYAPKTVQSTMASILRIASIDIVISDLDELQNNGYAIYGMDLGGTDMAMETFSTGKTAVVIGNESHGLSNQTLKKCGKLLRISMSGGAESLNAAVAAGIVLYKVAETLKSNKY